jgi:DNA polymerase I-like protein with 3'-5' exonuclease and polymerase domains
MSTNWEALLTPSKGKSVHQTPKKNITTLDGINSKVVKEVPKIDLIADSSKRTLNKEDKRNNLLSSFKSLPDIDFIPIQCFRGNINNPKLMVVTESPGYYELEREFGHCGDAGLELDRVLSESGVDCGNFRSLIMASINLLEEEHKPYDSDIRELINQEYVKGEVLFYHLNTRYSVGDDGKVKNMRDEDYFTSLITFHRLVCRIKPTHILLLGGPPFEKILGKTNVPGYAGVTFDYQFPQFLQECINAGNKDPQLLSASQLNYQCLVDVDLHPAFVLQGSHHASSWSLRLSQLCKRLGQKVAQVPIKYVLHDQYEEACQFLQSWAEDSKLTGLSYDFETISLAACAWLNKSIIITINLCRDDDSDVGHVVPVWHKDCTWTTDQKIHVSRLIGNVLMKPRKISYGHNLLYDNLVARKDPYLGINPRRIPGERWDSMMFAYIVDEAGPQGLKDLCNIHTDMKNYEAPLEQWKKDHKWNKTNNYGDIPLEVLGPYGAYDAVANIRLSRALQKILREDKKTDGMLLATKMMGLEAQALEDLPFWGQHIDKDTVFKVSKSHHDVIDGAIKTLLDTPEMKSFIEGRVVERADKYAREELSKPLNSFKAYMSVHPIADKVFIKSVIKEALDGIKDDKYVIDSDGGVKLMDGSKHPHSEILSEIYMIHAQKQYDIDTGKIPDPKTGSISTYKPNFNTNGSGEMGKFFFQHLNLPADYVTETGAPSLEKEALSNLVLINPIVKYFKDYKDAEKERGTYIDPLVDVFKAYESGKQPEHGMSADNICHYHVYCGRTVTGRTTSDIIQLIPRKGQVKKFFNSRFRNGVILQSDLSQVELRVFASVSNDTPMRNTYLSGGDLHMSTTLDVFGQERWDHSDKKERKEIRTGSKKVNFGLCFGTGAQGLMHTIKAEGVEVLKLGGYDVEKVYQDTCKKLHLDRSNFRHKAAIELEIDNIRCEIAQSMIDKFYKEHREAKQWIESVHEFVLENGYYYSPFGRIRRLPRAFDPMVSVRNECLRQAQNFPVQSAASDLAVVSLAAIEKDIQESNLRAVPCLAVHDMIGVDSPIEEADQVASILNNRMCNVKKTFADVLPEFSVDWLTVPMLNDLELGPSWGQSYSYKEGKLKVADEEEGAPETVWIPTTELNDWLLQHSKV